MSTNIEIPNFSNLTTQLKREANRIVGIEAKKFFQDSFRKGGFTDTSFTPWKETNNPLSGKKTMYGHGNLMGSIRTKRTDYFLNKVTVECESEYGEIHNKGGYITVTPEMKKFFWWKYSEMQKVEKQKTKRGKFANNARNRKIDAKAIFFKRMALMHSKTMMNQIEKQYIDTIVKKWKESFK